MTKQEISEEIRQLEFLDLSVALGRPGVPSTGGFYCEKEDVLDEMKRLGIKNALTYHITAKGYQSVYGNERLIKEIGETKDLIISWVLVPDEDEMGCTPSQFVIKLKENNVKAVRLFPASQSNASVSTRYAFSKWFYGDFMEALEKDRVPVILSFNPHRRAEPEWDKIFSLASEFPHLPIILTDVFTRATWSLVKLMKLMPNIFVQTTGLCLQRQLEYMVNMVGPERFIAGSNFPDMHLGAMIAQVFLSNLTYEQKKLIAGDNARRLMGIIDEGGRK